MADDARYVIQRTLHPRLLGYGTLRRGEQYLLGPLPATSSTAI
jgi:hypothetical protein